MMMESTRMTTLFFITFVAMVISLSGCGNQTVEQPPATPDSQGQTEEKKLTVYTTLYPLYDFAKQIGGEHVIVRSLVPPGAEAHDFEPTMKEIAALNEAQLFIYNGAGFEPWAEKLTQNLDPNKTLVVEATKGLTLLPVNEPEESHQDEHGHEDEHADDHADEHAHGDFDPHVWLDPLLAKELANHIYEALASIDPSNKGDYKSNLDRLISEIGQVHAQYEQVVSNASTRELVVAHSAYQYLAKRYGLTQIPISGISPSQEPSQKQLQQLIKTVKEHGVKYIAFEQNVTSKVAETVMREVGAEAVTLSNLENVTKEQFAAGITYVELMTNNLETLKKVLGAQ